MTFDIDFQSIEVKIVTKYIIYNSRLYINSTYIMNGNTR